MSQINSSQYGNAPQYAPELLPPLPNEPEKKSGCGCSGCVMGCLGLVFASFLICGGVAWYAMAKLPMLAKNAANKIVEDSDLSPEDKAIVQAQIERVADEYEAGRIDKVKAKLLMDNLAKSPLFPLAIVMAVEHQYLNPSNLPESEQDEGRLALQRFGRGVFEKKISQESVNKVLDLVSTKGANGGRQFKDRLSNDELRAFLAECRRFADSAGIPNEPFEVQIGEEFKRIVDAALSETPEAVMPEVEKLDIQN